MTLEEVAATLLSNSCSNPAEDWDEGEKPSGFNRYRIELCCTAIEVIAKPTSKFNNDKGYVEDWEIQNILICR